MILTQQIKQLSELVGLPPDLLKTAMMLILSVPLSIIYRFHTSSLFRNALSVLFGSLLLLFIIQLKTLFILVAVILPYITIQIIGHPFLTMVIFSFLYLLYIHGQRYFFNDAVWKVDCDMFVMFLVTKMTYYGKWRQNNNTNKSIIDYAGYALFFPGMLAGPTFSYQIYLQFINNKVDTSIQKINWKKALGPLFGAVIFLIITIVTIPIFGERWVLESTFYLSLSLWQKILILNLVGFAYRVKFYAGWYFSQTATNLSGLSLSSSGQYDAAQVGSIEFQIQPNPKLKTQLWNRSIQVWLRNVVYNSVVSRLGAQASLYTTFLFSAFWHGINWSYYIGFALWGVLLHVNKWIYKWSQAFPEKVISSLPVRIIAFLASSSLLNFLGMIMVILDWKDCFQFIHELHYWAFIVLFGMLILTFVLKPPEKSIRSQAKKQ